MRGISPVPTGLVATALDLDDLARVGAGDAAAEAQSAVEHGGYARGDCDVVATGPRGVVRPLDHAGRRGHGGGAGGRGGVRARAAAEGAATGARPPELGDDEGAPDAQEHHDDIGVGATTHVLAGPISSRWAYGVS